MINIEIICIGKIKEKYITQACLEYIKRLDKYIKLKITELDDESLTYAASNLTIQSKIKETESKKIENRLLKLNNAYIIALSPNGKQVDSLEFAEKIKSIPVYNSSSSIVFLVGGSLGLSDKLISKCNESISFSKLTFPHQLFRVILLEQIYRACKIIKGETYHK